ncbi:MAG: RNA methyltransferase, partial [Phycisphaeraceae bacterium]|nr:RNA methyltransferase [Phycisphaeraceae bacterium]
MITTILDPEDSRLDPFRRIRDRDLRADGGRFVVESPRVVSRFLTAVREDRA